MNKKIWLPALLLTLFVLITILSSKFFDPILSSNNPFNLIIHLFVLILFLIFLPLYPALTHLDMTKGDMIPPPTILGFVLGTIFYDLILILIGLIISKRSSKKLIQQKI